jgi:hypothetical protein
LAFAKDFITDTPPATAAALAHLAQAEGEVARMTSNVVSLKRLYDARLKQVTNQFMCYHCPLRGKMKTYLYNTYFDSNTARYTFSYCTY